MKDKGERKTVTLPGERKHKIRYRFSRKQEKGKKKKKNRKGEKKKRKRPWPRGVSVRGRKSLIRKIIERLGWLRILRHSALF